MKLQFPNFSSFLETLDASFLFKLNDTFRSFVTKINRQHEEIREFVSAVAGTVTRNLPDGNKNSDVDYYYLKTDSSVNTVDIIPFGTQTINGAAGYSLTAQYMSATLVWDAANQLWHLK